MSKPSLWWPKKWKYVTNSFGGNMLRGRILKLQKPFLFHWAHFNSPLMKATFKGMVQQSGPRLIIFLNILHNLLAWHLRVLIHPGESPFFRGMVISRVSLFKLYNSSTKIKSILGMGLKQYIPRHGFRFWVTGWGQISMKKIITVYSLSTWMPKDTGSSRCRTFTHWSTFDCWTTTKIQVFICLWRDEICYPSPTVKQLFEKRWHRKIHWRYMAMSIIQPQTENKILVTFNWKPALVSRDPWLGIISI